MHLHFYFNPMHLFYFLFTHSMGDCSEIFNLILHVRKNDSFISILKNDVFAFWKYTLRLNEKMWLVFQSKNFLVLWRFLANWFLIVIAAVNLCLSRATLKSFIPARNSTYGAYFFYGMVLQLLYSIVNIFLLLF